MVRLAAVGVIGLGGVFATAAGAQARAMDIVDSGCVNGNYWFVVDNGGGYGWGVVYNSSRC